MRAVACRRAGLLLAALLVGGCWSSGPDETTPAESVSPAESVAAEVPVGREEVEASGAQKVRVVLGFTPKAQYEETAEGRENPLEEAATYHIDVHFFDSSTGAEATAVREAELTVANPKGEQQTHAVTDQRAKYGHFCHGFVLEPRKQYQITVKFRGDHAGASVAMFQT